MEVIEELALRIPATLICELMGVPTTDQARFHRVDRAGHAPAHRDARQSPTWTTRAKRAPRSPTTSERSTRSAAPRPRTTC
jgi:cytochrome P450